QGRYFRGCGVHGGIIVLLQYPGWRRQVATFWRNLWLRRLAGNRLRHRLRYLVSLHPSVEIRERTSRPRLRSLEAPVAQAERINLFLGFQPKACFARQPVSLLGNQSAGEIEQAGHALTAVLDVRPTMVPNPFDDLLGKFPFLQHQRRHVTIADSEYPSFPSQVIVVLPRSVGGDRFVLGGQPIT